MKNYKFLWSMAVASMFSCVPNFDACAQGTAFTYQGQLSSGGQPANGSYDFQFTLYPTNATGAVVAGPVTNLAVSVSNGLFTTQIDFGAGVFTGGPSWLQLGVQSNGGGGFTALMPRQEITPAPAAIFASSASNLTGSLPVAQLTGTLPASQLPDAVVTNGGPSGNFFAGSGAGVNSTGTENTGVGNSALYANTTGNFNTALGQAALINNSSGYQNTAVGQYALFANTNGFENTGIGAGALGNNVSGANNTAVGIQALNDIVNGTGSTAVGGAALYFATGSGNIALGASAGFNVGVGSNNIEIGNVGLTSDNAIIRLGTPGTQTDTYLTGVLHGDGSGLTNLNVAQLTGVLSATQLPANLVTNGAPALNFFAASGAGASDTTGGQNVGIGPRALGNNTNGAFNTAVGTDALQRNSSGLQNTAVGGDAMENNNGSQNTAVGYNALSHNTNGGNNIALGVAAGVNLLNTSNNIEIGNTGAPFDSGVIRLGTPGAQTDTYLAGIVHADTVQARGGPINGFNSNNNGYTFGSPGDNDSGMSSSADGQIEFYSNGEEAMRIAPGGNVGIGLTSPGSSLSVNGNIQMGSGGGNYATSGTENLRIVRGIVNSDGSIAIGGGFSVPAHPSAGAYTINFSPVFSGLPVVTVTGVSTLALAGGSLSTGGVTVQLLAPNGAAANGAFSFIAIGPP